MKSMLLNTILQTALMLLIAPLITGIIRKGKATLQNRRGAAIWQPYADLIKLFQKDMVISEHASGVFGFVPYIVFVTALLAGLMVPMLKIDAPLQLFGGALAVIGLLALGRFFLALGGLDPATSFGGMGSSREMSLSAVAEPALMLSVFTLAIAAGSTNLSEVVRHANTLAWPVLNPTNLLTFAAIFIVLLAETGRVPVDNPATHLELTMIHEAMVLEYSGRYLALLEWGASIKQMVLMCLVANLFFPVGLGESISVVSCVALVLKILLIAGAVVLIETVNAKLRLFRVPNLLSGAFILAAMGLVTTFIFQ